jgi:hypothetical protein
MERRLSAASRRSAPSPIQQLSHLAQRVGAVNLAEGFPDFPAPAHVKAAATAAIAADLNQYRSISEPVTRLSSGCPVPISPCLTPSRAQVCAGHLRHPRQGDETEPRHRRRPPHRLRHLLRATGSICRSYLCK